MIRIKEIKVERHEGMPIFCGEKITSSFKEAFEFLKHSSITASKKGHDKHTVTFIWEDGSELVWKPEISFSENEDQISKLNPSLYLKHLSELAHAISSDKAHVALRIDSGELSLDE